MVLGNEHRPRTTCEQPGQQHGTAAGLSLNHQEEARL